MRILLVSHAAWRRTGYGAPVLPLIREWRRHGHDAAVLAVEERGPGVMEWRDVRHYFPTRAAWTGEDVLRTVADHFGADVVVSLLDPWVLSPRGYAVGGRPWLAWCPVDQDPPQRGLVERLQQATRALVFSRWGADVLRSAAPDLNVAALPYGVDLNAYKFVERARAEFREACGVDDAGFLVAMVGTNMRYDRKALSENVQAFCRFAARHDEARLILLTTDTGGVDLVRLLAAMPAGAASRVHFVERWQAESGVGVKDTVALYCGADVLLHASAAEGFGLPIVEAMACGTPVIAAANSSMTELVPLRGGWLVDDLRDEWSWLGGWWHRPTVRGIEAKLEAAYVDLGIDLAARPFASECRALAKAYSWEFVGEAWADVLKGVTA